MALSHGDPIDWQAESWDDLREIWQGLVNEAEATQPVSTFRGEEITRQQAGHVFERWVVEAFRQGDCDVEPAFEVAGHDDSTQIEQIDGLIYDGWSAFLIESKFTPKSRVDFGDIARLRLRVERRPTETMGLLFAPFSYTVPARHSVRELRPIRVLMFDRQDLDVAIETSDLLRVVRVKWKFAVKYGDPNKAVTLADLR